jgi:hypothetical protein
MICAAQQCTTDADKSAVNAFAIGYCENGSFGPSGTYPPHMPPPTPSATVTVTSVVAQATASSQTSQKKSETLNTATQVGIAVGGVIAVLIIGTTALLLWRRKLRQRKTAEPGSQDESPVHEIDAVIEPKEIEEMWAPPVIHELPATRGASPALAWRPENRHLRPNAGAHSPDISPEQQTVSPVEINDDPRRPGQAM